MNPEDIKKQQYFLDVLWTIEELSKYLQAKPSVIKYWIRCAGLPHIRIGKQIRFDPADIKFWVTNRKNDADSGASELRRIT